MGTLWQPILTSRSSNERCYSRERLPRWPPSRRLLPLLGHRKAGRLVAPRKAGKDLLLSRHARHVALGFLFISYGVLVSCATHGEPPERLRAQVAPEPTSPWRAPGLREYSKALKPTEQAPIDPAHQYDLPELVDVAERVNPETRVAWERARQAAIGVGLVESEYFPVLSLAAFGGYQSLPLPAPQNLIPQGFFRIDVAHFVPGLNLKWLLLDFGRRGDTMDIAKERLLAANLGFNRTHQDLAFRVQRAFYALTGIRARIAVAQAALDAARSVQAAAESRYGQGLETVPEVLLARQQAVQAQFDLEESPAKERDAQVTLAESMGILPTTTLQLVDFTALALPPHLEDSVEKVIDRALEQRPDLIAKVAIVREKEAAVRRARADYFPTLFLTSDVGGELARFQYDLGTATTNWASIGQLTYGAGLRFEWQLFEGGARACKVELAEAERRAAEQEVSAAGAGTAIGSIGSGATAGWWSVPWPGYSAFAAWASGTSGAPTSSRACCTWVVPSFALVSSAARRDRRARASARPVPACRRTLARRVDLATHALSGHGTRRLGG